MLNNIEILSRVIMDDASREAKAILDKARKESDSIKEEGFRKAEELKKEAMKSQGQFDLLCDNAKMVSLAEFQARSEILGRKETIIKEVLQEVKKLFFSLPERKDYPKILKKLIRQALICLEADGSEFICRVNQRDHSLLSSSILKDLGGKTDKLLLLDKSPVDIVGGVIVFRSDLRVFYDNSLEAVFERNIQQMRCMAAEYIFEKR
ncbi:MAG: hypothetical protein JSU78_02640 [Deltaproteobacteria bacterium]|nr:MAG: hypothetical protein JSU78_02640 [Deltaproteobacteria bacterium]